MSIRLHEMLLTDAERRFIDRALRSLESEYTEVDAVMAYDLRNRMMITADEFHQAPQLSATHPGGDSQA